MCFAAGEGAEARLKCIPAHGPCCLFISDPRIQLIQSISGHTKTRPVNKALAAYVFCLSCQDGYYMRECIIHRWGCSAFQGHACLAMVIIQKVCFMFCPALRVDDPGAGVGPSQGPGSAATSAVAAVRGGAGAGPSLQGSKPVLFNEASAEIADIDSRLHALQNFLRMAKASSTSSVTS